MAAAPAESTCSHSGIFTCGPARLTTAITSGARARRLRSYVDLLRLGVGIFGAERGPMAVAGREPRLALEHDEAPGRELAMVGHARGDRSAAFRSRPPRGRAAQLDRLQGAPGFAAVQELRASCSPGPASPVRSTKSWSPSPGRSASRLDPRANLDSYVWHRHLSLSANRCPVGICASIPLLL